MGGGQHILGAGGGYYPPEVQEGQGDRGEQADLLLTGRGEELGQHVQQGAQHGGLQVSCQVLEPFHGCHH